MIRILGVFQYVLILTFSLLLNTSFGQQPYSISGTVRDFSSGETIAGASVHIGSNENISGRTNAYGFFSLTVPAGEYNMNISFVGYQTKTQQIVLKKDTSMLILLDIGNTLDAVQINANSSREILNSSIMGTNKLQMGEILKVPVLFGEKDVLKTIQLLPGVISGGEGNSGFYVRGGAIDQNLIILDEATVYNASHLFGFFSTFNSDAIKEVTLYKGGMPPKYGGRLSSVLDINMLDGNKKEFKAQGGIGLIASRLALEGPLKKDKGSFMISARRTYADMFLKLSKDSTVNNSSLYFYDLNLKTNYQFNEENTLYLSGYFGKDVLGYAKSFGFDWGNATATLRWNHVFSPRLFSNTSLIYGDFNYNVDVYDNDVNFNIASLIRSYTLKQDFQFYAKSNHIFRFGLEVLKQKISPANFVSRDTSTFSSLESESRSGIEINTYVSHDWSPSERINMLYGFRLSNFLATGPGTFNKYDQDGDIINSREYKRSEIVKNYFILEPRISINYKINQLSSIKASYNRNSQNLHLLSNSTASLPTDVWIMSSQNIKPQLADQVAIGYFRTINDDQLEFSTELYYKDMKNQIDFKTNADVQANPNVEADLIYGKGRAYGLELFLKKSKGKLNGWVSYTISRSERQFDEINQGNWFAARQDRIHDLSLVAMYQINNKWSFSSTFIYSTGNAVTFPSGKYVVDEKPVWYYSERNGYRMPDYHRLDLGFTYEPKPKSKLKSTWDFGLYNIYNHKNAYMIEFRENENNRDLTEAYKISLFGIIPSVTWNFKF
jgi:hypothetical protein